jgi:hypothetical protein
MASRLGLDVDVHEGRMGRFVSSHTARAAIDSDPYGGQQSKAVRELDGAFACDGSSTVKGPLDGYQTPEWRKVQRRLVAAPRRT